MQQVSGQAVNQQVCIAMSGVAKVFVGELVEEALKVAVSINYTIVYSLYNIVYIIYYIELYYIELNCGH